MSINKERISNIVEINEPIIKTLIFFLNIFLSVKGKSNKPNITIIGNLKKKPNW